MKWIITVHYNFFDKKQYYIQDSLEYNYYVTRCLLHGISFSIVSKN